MSFIFYIKNSKIKYSDIVLLMLFRLGGDYFANKFDPDRVPNNVNNANKLLKELPDQGLLNLLMEI